MLGEHLRMTIRIIMTVLSLLPTNDGYSTCTTGHRYQIECYTLPPLENRFSCCPKAKVGMKRTSQHMWLGYRHAREYTIAALWKGKGKCYNSMSRQVLFGIVLITNDGHFLVDEIGDPNYPPFCQVTLFSLISPLFLIDSVTKSNICNEH